MRFVPCLCFTVKLQPSLCVLWGMAGWPLWLHSCTFLPFCPSQRHCCALVLPASDATQQQQAKAQAYWFIYCSMSVSGDALSFGAHGALAEVATFWQRPHGHAAGACECGRLGGRCMQGLGRAKKRLDRLGWSRWRRGLNCEALSFLNLPKRACCCPPSPPVRPIITA